MLRSLKEAHEKSLANEIVLAVVV